ncbi:type II toxin-antitoxin system PemK/MazF family toxin [Lonepinella sp. BR2474]|uniref:type II toxin-antitoxin system PemK/MazF family toxin n=1 Tax=Lonepinella sp. BR2474 TaxID=3434548 RepID=UPI003F6E1E43
MAIKHRPKVGEILECDFGQWSETEHCDGHIPPEMRKKRIVAVLNGNIDGKSALVVPISSNESNRNYLMKYHVPLDPELFQITDFYDKRERWALCERITTISTKRLYYIINGAEKLSLHLPKNIVADIQKHVIIALNAKILLKNDETDLIINPIALER